MEVQDVFYTKSEYVETASGNKVSRHTVLCGSQNIVLHGKVIVQSDAIIRGDLASVRTGRYCIISKRAVLRPSFKKYSKGVAFFPLHMGDHVFVGENAVVSAAVVGSYVYIGNNVVIGRRCVLKDCCYIEDNTVLPPETVVHSFSRYAGSPGVCIGELPECTQELMVRAVSPVGCRVLTVIRVFAITIGTLYMGIQARRLYTGDKWRAPDDLVPEVAACMSILLFTALELRKDEHNRYESSHMDQIPPLLVCLAVMSYTSSWPETSLAQGPDILNVDHAPLVFASWAVAIFVAVQIMKILGISESPILDGVSPFISCVAVVLHTFPEFTRMHNMGYKMPLNHVLPGMLAYLAMTCYSASRVATLIVGHCFGPYVDLLPGGVACVSVISSAWILSTKLPFFDLLPAFLCFCVVLFYFTSEVTRLHLPASSIHREQFTLLIVSMVYFCYCSSIAAKSKITRLQ